MRLAPITKNQRLNWVAVLTFVWHHISIFCLLLLALIVKIYAPQFWTISNTLTLIEQSVTIGILAIGMTFVVIPGEVDLSVGSVAALAGLISALLSTAGVPPVISILFGLLAGLMAGFLNGIAVALLRLPSAVTTIAMLSIARGLAAVISHGRPIPADSIAAFVAQKFYGISGLLIIFLLVIVITSTILGKTTLGLSIYAIGGNKEAARMSGLPVQAITITTFVISGFLAALAGIVATNRLTSADPQFGTGYEIDTLAAVVVGGSSLTKGTGSVSETVVGAIMLTLIRTSMGLLHITTLWQHVVIGVIIALALGLDNLDCPPKDKQLSKP